MPHTNINAFKKYQALRKQILHNETIGNVSDSMRVRFDMMALVSKGMITDEEAKEYLDKIKKESYKPSLKEVEKLCLTLVESVYYK